MDEDALLPGFEFIRRIYLGAEAELIHGIWASKDVVIKRRIAKSYRVKELDARIIWSRTLREAAFIHEAKKVGVLTPTIYHLNPKTGIIVMSFENFPTLKNIFSQDVAIDLRSLGRAIGILHTTGIVHGDLTPSNILLSPAGPIFLDFGLSERTKENEMFAEDLYLLKRSLEGLLDRRAETVFKEILEGYSVEVVYDCEKIKAKIEEISKRGRYTKRGANYV